MKKLFVLIALLAASTVSHAQAAPTAQKTADVQLGVTYSGAKSDYGSPIWNGFGFYGNLDLRYHLGVEFDFHQLNGPDSVLYERTYEAGVRYLYPIHDRFVPYTKVMIGRGVFNFSAPDSTGKAVEIANLAYNIGSIGGGLDLRVLPGLNVRVIDYEYQHWGGFPPRGLTPSVLSVGVAYHFHGKMGLKN